MTVQFGHKLADAQASTHQQQTDMSQEDTENCLDAEEVGNKTLETPEHVMSSLTSSRFH